MISKIEYEILQKLKNNEPIDDCNFFEEIYSLRQDGLITLDLAIKKYRLTGHWQRAIEEYESFIVNENRENETLKKSRNSNILSLIAIIVPSLISVGALIVSILAYLKN